MTADLAPTHPLHDRSAELGGLPGEVTLTAEPWVASVDLRVPDPIAVTLGVPLPTAPNRFTEADGVRAVWLGPDEWLVTSTHERPEALVARVRAAVAPLGGTATDVSAARTGLRLRGARVRDVLARGCSVDVHPRVFGRGSSAQTTLAQAAVVLLSLSDTGDDFLVLVRSSFAGHLANWWVDASLEFTAVPTP